MKKKLISKENNNLHNCNNSLFQSSNNNNSSKLTIPIAFVRSLNSNRNTSRLSIIQKGIIIIINNRCPNLSSLRDLCNKKNINNNKNNYKSCNRM